MSSEKLDAIIFGASGFTGKIVVEDAVEILKDFKWGIAGRNEAKLKAVLETIGTKVGHDLSHIPIIIADVDNQSSLDVMAKKCKIVLNCCGPFRLYGEAVVRACVDNGTHHVDITGEPQYADLIQLKYNELAQQKGSYVIPTCGFESIPAEMGVLYAELNHPGILNSVELYWETKLNYVDKSSKAILHSGTWDSIVYYMQHSREIASLQRQLNCERIREPNPKLKLNSKVHQIDGLNSFFVAMPTAACFMVQRSQRLLNLCESKRPVQFGTYIGFTTYWWALFFPLLMMIGCIMARYEFTRNLLLKYPHIFSFGFMTHEGPVEANRKAIEFNYILKAKGWYQSTPHAPDPTHEIVVRISAKDHYYGVTSKALLLCARTILTEGGKMPGNGGVIPPGYAFYKTSLLQEMCSGKYGLKIELL
ncbi:saccharopine dehydrogenase-like oxidoreductase [Musca autumnalis]|uniref:saccharopine dehydrogenase-like oxidoreductase n=1 Tax=Musca autumnalis TaxID=221902 RepID=UPI003CFBA639